MAACFHTTNMPCMICFSEPYQVTTITTSGSGDKAFYNAGVEAEQRRIIKIIELANWSGMSIVEDIQNLVRLIKGEQK